MDEGYIHGSPLTTRSFDGHDILHLQLILVLLRLDGQRPLLDHQCHDFVQRVCCCHGRKLGIRVVRRCDLDNVAGNEVNAFETTNDGP